VVNSWKNIDASATYMLSLARQRRTSVAAVIREAIDRGLPSGPRRRCRGLVDAIRQGEVIATTTVEAIREFTHVRARRRDRSDAAKGTG
jgi:hypothetical protein